MNKNVSIKIGNEEIHPGERKVVMLPMPQLYDCSPMYMPINVICGRQAGPVLVICAAIHGDEINGVEIVRLLLRRKSIENLHGTLIAIPIVNVYGFIYQSRYLMDRRDLNRAFPGSKKGSLTGRLANFILKEVISNATHVIDLHTGSLHRTNVPQIRASLENKINKKLACVFGAPVILDSKERDGSLRQAMSDLDIPYILFEAGEALRFDKISIRMGLLGISNVMRYLGMLPKKEKAKHHCILPSYSYKTNWVRSKTSGIMIPQMKLGAHVNRGDVIAIIANPLSVDETEIKSSYTGIIIGKTNLPLIHEGEALFHIARVEEPKKTSEQISLLKKI